MARVVNVWRAPRQPNTTSWTDIPLIDIISFNVVMNTPIWIEMSENDLGIPVAAMPVLDKDTKVWRFPKEIWEKFEPKTYHFRTVDNIGKEIFQFTYTHYQAV